MDIHRKKVGLKRRVGLRKSFLVGLVVAVLIFAVLSMSDIGIAEVSSIEWTGLGEPKCVAIGDYDNDGLDDLALSEYRTGQVTVIKVMEQP